MLVFESNSLERTEEFLSEHYAPMQIGSGSEQVATRVARSETPEVSVDRLDIGFEMAYDVEPLGKICLCDIESGTIDSHAPDGAAVEDFGAGDLFSFSPPDRAYMGTINRARYTITMIDPAVLAHVASPGRGADAVELLGHRPVDRAAAGRLRATIDHLDRSVLSDPAAAANELVRGSAVRYLAAQVLATFPNTSMVGPSAADDRDAHPAAVRRAVAYIDAHADADVSLAEVAAAAHVSIRSLQLAFRRHLDTTPMGYLRAVRLARARHELSAAQPGDGASVARIALRWGFANQGRFGQWYQQEYGETPGTTLRRLR
jgi:AraC-like DNA-binding protein